MFVIHPVYRMPVTGGASCALARKQTEHFLGNAGADQGRDFSMIERRRHLDHIGTHQVDSLQATDEFQSGVGVEPSDYRGAGTGCAGRIEEVDVETQITGVIANAGLDSTSVHPGLRSRVFLR
jgi:hypothetical protein